MSFPAHSQKSLLAKHASAERVTQVRIISRDGDVFEFEGVLPQPVTAVIVAAAFKLPYTATVMKEHEGVLLCGRDAFCCETHGSDGARGCECWCHDVNVERAVRCAVGDRYSEARRLVEKAALAHDALAHQYPSSSDKLKAETLRRFAEVFMPTSREACEHPRPSWYGDREYGTTFCGACHKQLDDAFIEANK